MFIEAIEKAKEFTRPIYFISRFFDSTEVIPGTATIFFVNEEGYALTCGHVADELLLIIQVQKKYEEFKAEIPILKSLFWRTVQALRLHLQAFRC